MRIFAVMPVKNEAGRYLDSCLANVASLVDELFVYDDRSDDETMDIVSRYTTKWWVRQDGIPSFLEHEGRMRQDAWDQFETQCRPEPGDWVLAMDADEALVTLTPDEDVCTSLAAAVCTAADRGCNSVLIPVPEVFGYDSDGTPMVRTDGYWGTIAGTRLFAYQPLGVFNDKPMGCGSEPTYIAGGLISRENCGLRLMHFGYAEEADQIAKHERYTALLDHGHDNKHVQSIVQAKTLKRWEGPIPTMIQGAA